MHARGYHHILLTIVWMDANSVDLVNPLLVKQSSHEKNVEQLVVKGFHTHRFTQLSFV